MLLDLKNVCTQCNCGVNENRLNILYYCPIYQGVREHFKINYFTSSEMINNQSICISTASRNFLIL